MEILDKTYNEIEAIEWKDERLKYFRVDLFSEKLISTSKKGKITWPKFYIMIFQKKTDGEFK